MIIYAKSIHFAFFLFICAAILLGDVTGKEERKKTMKIAALYDIHGNLPALKAVLNEIDREGVDVIVMG